MVNIVNLTPHAVHVNEKIFLPSGLIARCQDVSHPYANIDDIELITRQYGNVELLNQEKQAIPFEIDPNTLYIVSAMVRLALPKHDNLASPGDLIRDENGQIVGCTNLVVNDGGYRKNVPFLVTWHEKLSGE